MALAISASPASIGFLARISVSWVTAENKT
jgi:hypothetical protein